MHEIPARRHRRSRTALPALLAAGCVSASTAEGRAAELLACEGTEIDLRAILEDGSPPPSFAIESDSLDDGSILVSHAAFSAVFEDGIPFFGQRTHFYANNNGNITFGEPMTSYTPDAIPGLYQPTIAPWFGDVDFHAASGDWTMCVEPDNQRMMITWRNVGYYSGHDDRKNSFQIVLLDTDQSCGEARNFDLEIRYERLEWTTGDASGGEGGLGGVPAVAGIDAGDGEHAVALPGSGTHEVLGLVSSSNVDEAGVFRFFLTEHGLPTCGDGVVDACEACDDGNDDNTDGCTNLCQPARCGDGFVWEGHEQCDGEGPQPSCPEGEIGAPKCVMGAGPSACTLDFGDCTSPDPCSEVECPEHSECVADGGQASCACVAGYARPSGAGACIDVDECASTENTCGDGAKCTNTPGSYVCSCEPGYEGDGETCVPVDECAPDPEVCGPNASCQDLVNGFHCVCADGYRRVEETCEDIDECAEGSHDCSAVEACTNEEGHFTCCPIGWVAVDGVCERRGTGTGGDPTGQGGSGEGTPTGGGGSGEGGSGDGGSGDGGSGEGEGGEGGSGEGEGEGGGTTATTGTGAGVGVRALGSRTWGHVATTPRQRPVHPRRAPEVARADHEEAHAAGRGTAPAALDQVPRGASKAPTELGTASAAPGDDLEDDASAGASCAAAPRQGGSSLVGPLMAALALLGARRRRS